jgi:hypothetical protein
MRASIPGFATVGMLMAFRESMLESLVSFVEMIFFANLSFALCLNLCYMLLFQKIYIKQPIILKIINFTHFLITLKSLSDFTFLRFLNSDF